MRTFIKILRVIAWVLSFLGGLMTFFNNVILSSSINFLKLTTYQIEYWGFVILVGSILLGMLLALIVDMIKDSGLPVLSWGKLRTEQKPVIQEVSRTMEGKQITSQFKLADLCFAYIDINNNPKFPNRITSAAERAHAQIIFKDKDGNVVREIEHGRWCDKDEPLLCGADVSVRDLKTIDINPGNPVSLVLAFRRKNSKEKIYAYYFTDHKKFLSKDKIKKILEERLLGKPPFRVIIRIAGKFEPKKFEFTLDINKKGEFITVNE